MTTATISTPLASVYIYNSKVLALESSLQQSLCNLKELLTDFETLYNESNKHKAEFLSQKEKCKSKTCCGAEELKKVIELKDNIIQSTASTLTRLSETKNWSMLDDVFTILFGESAPVLNHNSKQAITKTASIKLETVTPKKELDSPDEKLPCTDESVSEIEGTPTGRSSPIIHSKKMKAHIIPDRDKKKCPGTWNTSDDKAIKLTFTSPSGSKKSNRLRQARLNIVKMKTTNVIDITNSPEFCGGNRTGNAVMESNIQPLIKTASLENDDTILPSPTSERTNFTLYKSPLKFKKPPPLKLKTKTEKTSVVFKKKDPDVENNMLKVEKRDVGDVLCVDDMNNCNSVTYTQDDSINILHPDRLSKLVTKSFPINQKQDQITENSPKKQKLCKKIFHDTQSSVSVLQHVKNLDDVHKIDSQLSPSKVPLSENINATNIPEDEMESSMLLLPRDYKLQSATENVKRRLVELVEVREESTPRTRAEKRQLPGWACEKCVNFFSELHKDDPEAMWKKINECSHHRGVNNPERPKTPPGYWNPRWKVPEDTEEFNRRNNL